MNPFSTGGQTYQGGAYLAAGLGHFGDAVAGALKEYGDLSQQQSTMDALVSQLNQTKDPTDPTGKKTIIPDSAMKSYLAHGFGRRAAAGAGLVGALKMFDSLKEAYSRTQLEQAQAAAIPSETELRQAQAAHFKALANFQPGGTAVPVRDENGQIIGRSIPTAPGQAQYIPQGSPMAGQKIYSDKGEEIGIYDESGGVHLYSQANPLANLLPGLFGGAGTPSTGQPAPAQQPAAQQQQPQQPTTQQAPPAATQPQAAPTTQPQRGPMTPQDQQALAWARTNPQDPRARAIFAKLGIPMQ